MERKLKIGFFCNTNNFPFSYAYTLKKLGHDVIVVVTEKYLLHRPESRFPEFKNYPNWIIDVSHLEEEDFMFYNPILIPTIDKLSKCDLVFLNSYGISYQHLIGKPSIAMFTGFDLSNYANYDSIISRTACFEESYKQSKGGKRYLKKLTTFINLQRSGIKNSLLFFWTKKGILPEEERLLSSIKVDEGKRFTNQSASLDVIDYTPYPDNNTIRVFNIARFTWKLPIEIGRSHMDYKGSDIMIKGLAQFYQKTGIKLDIVFVKKGLHLQETYDLIKECKLDSQITWLDEMSQSDFWEECKKADIIFDQLSPTGTTGLAPLDAMTIGRPVIANPRQLDDEVPILRAQTPEQVAKLLETLVSDKSKRIEIGIKSHEYAKEFFSIEKNAESILNSYHHYTQRSSIAPVFLNKYLQKVKWQLGEAISSIINNYLPKIKWRLLGYLSYLKVITKQRKKLSNKLREIGILRKRKKRS